VIQFLFRRIIHAAVTMLVAAVLIFVSVRVLPGSPLLAQFGQHTDEVQMARIRAELGYDQPLWQQLGRYASQLLRGDLGESIVRQNESVASELRKRIPATLELTLAAVAISLPLGIVSGVFAAMYRNRWPDYLSMLGALLGVSIPVFFLGICLKAIFTGLPTGYRLPITVAFESLTGLVLVDTLLRGRLDLFWEGLRHLFLPALALSSIPTATIARITRSAMLDALAADFVRTAKAKGSTWLRIVWRHAFPNAAVPVASIAGFQIGFLLSGAVLTETVFDWPGMGKWLVAAVQDHDYNIVQAGSFFIAGVFVSMNLLLDVLYAWLDPRIRLG
jgi:ABC-type dipeptide/oligopeptide/nickel transport system permease component